MISADNEYMEEAGKTLFTLNEDDRIRDRCEAIEDYRRIWKSVKMEMEERDAAIAEKDAAIAEKDSTIAELKAELARLQQLQNVNQDIL